jgi:orotidine-5'-phosphate decarboxylase
MTAMTRRPIPDRDRLIVALDLPDVETASAMVARLGDAVSFYKIGLELTFGGGLALAERLIDQGKQVFLDLKFHDIPNTVERGVSQVARLGATFLTVHAFPQTMRAAMIGVGDAPLKLLSVTVMTSYSDADLAEAGYSIRVADLVAKRAIQTKEIGLPGIVLSSQEAEAVRPLVGPDILLVTPGIRPAGAVLADQKRVMTPARALQAGADHIVVGRPITQSPDPRAAAEAIIADMATVSSR